MLAEHILATRLCRPPDHAAENRALRQLARDMVERPDSLYESFVELARELCRASSAGISLLELTQTGEEVFHRIAISGARAWEIGRRSPRHTSPCGECLDLGRTVLLERPARRFAGHVAGDPPVVESLIVPLFAHDGRPLGAIWVVSLDEDRRFDLEDMRVMEALAGFLALVLEKERLRRAQKLLYDELQHRNKNNLAMMVSLLSLQHARTAEPAARRALEAALERMRAVAEMQPDNLPGGVSDLPGLVRDICARLARGSLDRPIVCEIDVDEVVVAPDWIRPIALILNELVTNALKHAFPDGRPGRVTIRLRREGPGELRLLVDDDGVPLPEFSGHGSPEAGLGLGLVEGLAGQLGGRLVRPRGDSKTFMVCLPGDGLGQLRARRSSGR